MQGQKSRDYRTLRAIDAHVRSREQLKGVVLKSRALLLKP